VLHLPKREICNKCAKSKVEFADLGNKPNVMGQQQEFRPFINMGRLTPII